MPEGKGEKRPADVNARAVLIAKIATGEATDPLPEDARLLNHRVGKLINVVLGGSGPPTK